MVSVLLAHLEQRQLCLLGHDPDELFAAAPEVHLVDHWLVLVLALVGERGWDHQVQGVRALDPQVDSPAGRHLDPQLCECSGGLLGDRGIALGEHRQRLFEVGGVGAGGADMRCGLTGHESTPASG